VSLKVCAKMVRNNTVETADKAKIVEEMGEITYHGKK